jgi:tRNA A-37 threonylcarbamoyl transferase component Bud32
MSWSAPGVEELVATVVGRFARAVWPDPPDGFERVGPLRPMRQVLAGRIEDADGEHPSPRLFVKWSRPVTLHDRVRRRLAGGKGPREGRVLRALADRGIPVPRVLGFSDDGPDVLILEEIEALSPLPAGPAATRRQVEAVARLLGRAWRAGLRHRDLHRGNVGLAAGEPVLLDLGGARLSRGGSPIKALARLGHALAGDLSRAHRQRALRAWLAAAETGTRGDRLRERARDLAPRVERATRRVTRAYRRGRDRRATRSGRHFEVFGLEGGVTGVRRRETPASWRERALAWLDADPEGASPLKAGNRVVRFELPDHEGALVLKRYETAAPGRLPRAIRAFRLSVALEHRGIATPRVLLAVSRGRGGGVLVTEHVDALDLHRYAAEDGAEDRDRRALAFALGRVLRAMHDAEVTHRDLKAPNLLVSDAPPRIVVADVDGVRLRCPGWRRRARDLARLDASLDARETDRARVFSAYWRPLPRPPVDSRTFRAEIAKRVSAKRGPSGRPR